MDRSHEFGECKSDFVRRVLLEEMAAFDRDLVLVSPGTAEIPCAAGDDRSVELGVAVIPSGRHPGEFPIETSQAGNVLRNDSRVSKFHVGLHNRSCWVCCLRGREGRA